MNRLIEKTNLVLLEKYYQNKQEKSLEEQQNKLYKVIMNESSKHYVTKNKLEREEIARIEAEIALNKERQDHESTKKEMYIKITNLKRELEKHRSNKHI